MGHLQRRLLAITVAVAPVRRAALVVMVSLRFGLKIIERIVCVRGVVLPGRIGNQLILQPVRATCLDDRTGRLDDRDEDQSRDATQNQMQPYSGR
uniref:Putative secreted protein n=1 Tax=Anopheles darlingi TaxID=43151 RepID=A0A2M4DNT4_ANODA